MYGCKMVNNKLITEKEAARLLDYSLAAMRRNREKKRGPTYYKLGKRILYSPQDLDMFLESRRAECQLPPAA
jgi:hypothetical protein